MSSIQRYDAWPQEWPFEDEHGDLVTYEDHRKIVEELEAKLSKSEALLAKAVEAERVYCANVVKHFYDNGFFTKPDDIINRTTLAELKGQDDE